MAQKRRRSRNILTLIAIALIAAAMAYAFWPKPALVDLGADKISTFYCFIKYFYSFFSSHHCSIKTFIFSFR